MKKILFLAIMFVAFFQNSKAQYRNIQCDKIAPHLEIVQIDFTTMSTMVFLKYTNTRQNGVDHVLNFGENTFIRDKKANKTFKLLNGFNIPIAGNAEPKYHIFDRDGQEHYFVLEFEKLPTNIEKFDLIEQENIPDAINLYGIKINKNEVSEYINDINDFVESTPVKEYGEIIKDGNPIRYYKYKGLEIYLSMSVTKDYGKYYQGSITIENFTGKNILFIPDSIKAKYFTKDKHGNIELEPLMLLSYDDYMKKVKRSQNFAAAMAGLSSGLETANAGYSTSTTTSRNTTNTLGATNIYGATSSNSGTTYGHATGYNSSTSTTYGVSTTRTYDANLAQAVKQKENDRLRAIDQQLRDTRNHISERYVKSNTLFNQTEFQGFFNVKYTKTDKIIISIPINGETYTFPFFFKN